MKITRIDAPINGGTLYAGLAENTRGRRYSFMASADGDCCAYRERGRFWEQIKPPAALVVAIRKQLLEAIAVRS